MTWQAVIDSLFAALFAFYAGANAHKFSVTCKREPFLLWLACTAACAASLWMGASR